MAVEIPQRYKDLVGSYVFLSGGIFSGKSMPKTKVKVLGLRIMEGCIVYCPSTPESEYPALQLLVKADDWKRSRWTTGFPIREIDLNKVV